MTRPNEPGFSFPSGKTFSPPHPAIVRSVPVHPTLSRPPPWYFSLSLSIPFEEAVSEYSSRHRVKPGITGWAQINGYRGETDTLHKIKKRVEYDLEYIAKWSVWFDLYILFRTVPAVLLTKEVY